MFDQLDVLIRGAILGLMVAAPVGPIGLLVIRRTVQKGIVMGFATGIGAALADAFFGAVAAFGVLAILSLLEGYQLSLRIVGGVVLVLMAWKMWRAHPQPPHVDISVASVVKAVLSGFMLTVTNPVTVFAVLAVVTALGGRLSQEEAGLLTVGILIGSLLWWVMLSGGVACVRHHFTEHTIVTINRVTAVFLTLIAIWILVSAATGLLHWG